MSRKSRGKIASGEQKKQGAVNHKDLEVWKQSIELAKAVYDLTRNFPSSEMYGLTSQMRRSAVSIPGNIAEGAARKADIEGGGFRHRVLPALTPSL